MQHSNRQRHTGTQREAEHVGLGAQMQRLRLGSVGNGPLAVGCWYNTRMANNRLQAAKDFHIIGLTSTSSMASFAMLTMLGESLE